MTAGESTRAECAGDVQPGWVLRYRGEDRLVRDRVFSPPNPGDSERQVTIYFDASSMVARGDEGQTVHRVMPGGGE